MAKIHEVTLPDIGDFANVEIIEVLVAPGDRVEPEQSLLTLESEKATLDIPSPLGGLVRELKVSVGDRLNRGDLILTMELDEEVTENKSASPGGGEGAEQARVDFTPVAAVRPPPVERAPGEAERRLAPLLPRPADLVAIATGRKAHASPAVRRFARELGVDLALVRGSGPKERVLKEDVQHFVKRALSQGTPASVATTLPFALPPAPEVDFARFGPIEVRELSRIQKLSGKHLHRCWLSAPQVTQFDEADITELEAFRQAQNEGTRAAGLKLTLMPFLLKASARALQRMPAFKSSLSPDGESLVMKHYTHIGVAVDTPNGLVVPVVRDVDQKGLQDLAQELLDLSQKARAGKLLPGDMQGGCFSISSLGGIGGTAFTPIVNVPEVAILGVSRAALKPLWNGKEFLPRLLLPLSLSYDHRVIDGAAGARFTRLLAELLGDIRRLLL